MRREPHRLDGAPGEHRGVEDPERARDHPAGARGEREPRRCRDLAVGAGRRPGEGRHGRTTVRPARDRRGATRAVTAGHPTTGRRPGRPLAGEIGPTALPGRTHGPAPLGSPSDRCAVTPTVRTDRLVDLFEYQARDVFEKHGVPVLAGAVATTPEEARAAAERIGAASGGVTVVKAQVKTGGRGKAGGVKVAKTADEAEEHARAILGMDIKGHTVHQVMIAQGAQIAEEYYFSILLDRAEPHLPGHVLEGGRHGHRAARRRAPRGPGPGRGRPQRRHRRRQGPRDRRRRPASTPRPPPRSPPVLKTLWTVYRDEDATLVEVNPLVRTEDGDIVALDGKVTLDENAGFRHPEHEALEDHAETDPLEMAAKEKDLNYVKLDGSVGIIGNGAGLVMSTLDVVAYAGEEFGGQKPANFLDIGGGASAEVMANGLHIILSDPQVKSVFVNVFGGITACDAVANGIVGALDALGDEEDRPLVVRLDGNNVEEGRRILAERNHPRVIIEDTMDGAARKAAELASPQLTPEREERRRHPWRSSSPQTPRSSSRA